jgi:hypothetical protein
MILEKDKNRRNVEYIKGLSHEINLAFDHMHG